MINLIPLLLFLALLASWRPWRGILLRVLVVNVKLDAHLGFR